MKLVIFLTLWMASSNAQAAVYRIHTTSSGQATQFRRIDNTLAAPRRLQQAVRLDAYDLDGSHTGRLNARLNIRFYNDWGLDASLRDEARFSQQSNHLALDVAYIEWRPITGLEVSAGRQWAIMALGARDFDGLQLALRLPIQSATLSTNIYAGYDVQPQWELGLDWGSSWGATSTWSVQGIPYDQASRGDYGRFLFGMAAGMRYGDFAVNSAYLRRFSGGATTVLSEERVGLAASHRLWDAVYLDGNYAYHTLLSRTERLGAQARWQLPWERRTVLGVGYEHRHPWFDSSSIFNLFGVHPHQDYFMTAQRALEFLSTKAELRVWRRDYADDAVLGGALMHQSNIPSGWGDLNWDSTFSYQHESALRGQGQQWLGDMRLRIPSQYRRLSLFTRAVGLYSARDGRQPRAWQSHESARGEWAVSGVLGADYRPLDIGIFSLMVEISTGSYFAYNSGIFMAFELEAWR